MDEGAARKEWTNEIVAENIRTVGAIYIAWQLEEPRLFDIVDRLVERFAQRMLPIRDCASSAVLQSYHRDRDERLARHERFAPYGQVLGAPQADSVGVTANRDFNKAVAGICVHPDRARPSAPHRDTISPRRTMPAWWETSACFVNVNFGAGEHEAPSPLSSLVRLVWPVSRNGPTAHPRWGRFERHVTNTTSRRIAGLRGSRADEISGVT